MQHDKQIREGFLEMENNFCISAPQYNAMHSAQYYNKRQSKVEIICGLFL